MREQPIPAKEPLAGATDALEEATDTAKEPLEGATDTLGKATDTAKESLEEATDTLEETTDTAEESLEGVTDTPEEATSAPTPEPPEVPTETASSPDDLTAIPGIGPRVAESLIEGGLDSYAKLAAATPEDLAQALKRKVPNMEDWITQARKLVDAEGVDEQKPANAIRDLVDK